ncbi:MAG: formate C-acetyltransferase [Clostridium sp.]|jgi:formate C-acetyltransferase|nr:formate C-acetyltransferase [Clostridium sp.]
MSGNAWRNFTSGIWQENIDVRDFIVKNYTPYDGNESFLASSSAKTEKLWNKCKELLKEEHLKDGVLSIDTNTISGITSHSPGYIDEENELIKGLQTDSPLKRAVIPFGGIRMAKQACEKYNYKLSSEIDEIFNKFRKTHNDGVFSAYTKDMRLARRCGVITGLPDAYGRGRIIGDYRRVALYGVTSLINKKQEDLNRLLDMDMTEEIIRLREEVSEQIKALNELVQMAKEYGYDIRRPAKNALEAIQWTYFAFLGSLKETNGAANSLGRVSTFFDIYIERDLKEGVLSETEAQELIDQFVIKLRMVRHLRTPEYNELFAGDPVWITESIGGMCEDGRHMVTKTSFRVLQTLFNLGPAPEPNITILWSNRLPQNFKKFCAKVSNKTSSIQYENDDIMRTNFNDDYSISCCVSAMRTGKDMQFFGARCNLPKLLLLALNGGKDEITGEQVAPEMEPYRDEYLDYNKVMNRFRYMQKWLAKLYVNTMNIIHYMHDKYAYERLMMALHDTEVQRFMAFGLAGLSVLVDSLSAIKYTYVKVIRDERGLITDFEIKGDYPQFGNDDDRVDSIAVSVVRDFYTELKKCPTYRNSKHTLSILTITSNVVYGEKTGSTPDGRKKGEPFAPGANPMHGRDKLGALAALNSVAKIPYEYCKDGISLTITLVPDSLGKDTDSRINNLVAILDGYFAQRGHHININVLEKAVLEKAMKEPEKYPQLTIRVSGYAVNFIRLTPKQQSEVIARTFHRAR